MKKIRTVVLALCIILMGVQGAASVQAADAVPYSTMLKCSACGIGSISVHRTERYWYDAIEDGRKVTYYIVEETGNCNNCGYSHNESYTIKR